MRNALLGLAGFLLLLPAVWCQKKPAGKAQSSPAEHVQALMQSGNPAQAEAVARQWIKRSPQSAQGWNLLGVSLVQQKKFEEAQSAFSKSAQLDPKAVIPRQNLARLYFSRGQNDQGIAVLNEAQALGPLDKDLGLYFARELANAGKKERAIQVLEPIAQQGESVQSMLMLASLQFEQGHPDKAAAVLQKALEKAPNSEEVLYRYGQSSLASGAPAKAIPALKAATRMNDHAGDYFYLLGVAWMQASAMEDAIPALRRAAELEPSKALPRIGMGIALNGQREYAEAQKQLQQALTIDPENIQAMAAMAEALDGSGNSSKAQELAQIVVQREPQNVTANVVLGNILMNQGKLQESLAALKRAESSEDSSSRVQYLLSRVYSRLKQPAEAKKHLELYQQAQKDSEERLKQLRGVRSSGGMKR